MSTTESATSRTEYDQLWIGGAWTAPSSSARIEVTSPTTGKRIGSVPEAELADVDAAVAAARRAFDDPSGWSRWSPGERRVVLRRLADVLESRAEETARRTTAQNGMPIDTARTYEGVIPPMLLRYYADLAVDTPSEEVRPGLLGGESLVHRVPIGVVAGIVPWNYPQAITFLKLAPLLAAGCAVVLKPSPETVLDSFLLAQSIQDAGFPDGVVNIVPGGRELGVHLVSHPGVDKVSFTGSTAAGRQIGETCGRLLRPCTLELGGKSAAIVLDDADLQGNVEALFGATMSNNGQTCWLNSRVLAPTSRYDEVVSVLADLASSVTIGDPLDPDTQIGPLVSAAQRERVERYIAIGRSEGGRVVAGGGRPSGLDDGFFVQPTVFADVDNRATVAREEIFGPVLTVIRYDDEADAITIANDSEYGLGGTVWTTDSERGRAVARRVQSGTIGINSYVNDPTAPFGGIKASGLGRELGPEALEHYRSIRTVYLDGPVATE
jgi:aldehyde dehydrogenase (NAD+)